jgi:uncharacterized membrane protein
MPAYHEPAYGTLKVASLSRAIRRGWEMFVRTRPLSVSFAMIFAFVGVVILVAIERASFAPMIFPLTGGFMLIGPLLLTGFFAVADRMAVGEASSFSDIAYGFSRTSREMLMLAFVCTLLFMIWITDTATLYGFIVGRTPTPLLQLVSPSRDVVSFLCWSSLLGALLAFVIFSISAFSVPLLYYRRAGLVRAVQLSIGAVLANLVPCLLWAVILSVSIVVSILIFPLFLMAFPVLAFASHALYRELFPESPV